MRAVGYGLKPVSGRDLLGFLVLFTCALLLGGCAGSGQSQSPGWGSRTGLPDAPNRWGKVGRAARSAASSRQVWMPLAGAVVVGFADLDDNISDWAVRETPLFGRDAAKSSDTLLDIGTGALVVSALIAPADNAGDRILGAAAQFGTVVLTGGVTEGLKKLTGRERPNGRGDNSLPSGHASQAAVRTHLARTNLRYVDMPRGARLASDVALHTLTYATAWARVEGAKHYPSDVLAGIAIGNFFAEFLRASLFEGRAANNLSVQVMPGGGVLKFSRPLR